MKASSESGLCALTISSEATEVIRETTQSSLQQYGPSPMEWERKRGGINLKGRPSGGHVNWKPRRRSSNLRITRCAAHCPHGIRSLKAPLQLCPHAANEAAPIVARFYLFHLP